MTFKNDFPGRVTIARDDCRRFSRSSELEWMETNGLGGFSSGTVSGAHTRRYHGLYTAATRPPLGRVLTLSKLETSVCMAGHEIPLGCNVYNSTTVHPEGYQSIESFELNPWPTWVYSFAGITLQREIVMLYERCGVLIRYSQVVENGDVPEEIPLRIRPLFAWRDYHAIARSAMEREVHLEAADEEERSWVVRARNRPNGKLEASTDMGRANPVPEDLLLHLQTSHPTVELPDSQWYFDFSYSIESHRGDPTREDLFSPSEMFVEIPEGGCFDLWVGTTPLGVDLSDRAAMDALVEEEAQRRRGLTVPGFEENPTASLLARAADQFIVRRGSGLSTIIAGYPWFTDWGRDSMIALPGLALATGRFDEARDLLLTFARHVDRGVIPNRFPDEGDTPEYNTVDATLWMFEAAAQYVEASGDRKTLDELLLPVFEEIIEWHVRGTHYGIVLDPEDGLLRAGEEGAQLTWMDAKFNDIVFTPRHGKPVEINALWLSALSRMVEWAGNSGNSEFVDRCKDLLEKGTKSFNERFWDAENNRLFDVLDSNEPNSCDGHYRPNQIFAVSLPRTPLDPEKFEAVVESTSALVTPHGLRSLHPSDHDYRGKYGGGRMERDSAYHRGTVWGWLIGPYIEAYLRLHGDSEVAKDHARELLNPLLKHLNEAGLGQISEIFDGDEPHRPRGCYAQAWSVGEMLRVMKKFDLFTG